MKMHTIKINHKIKIQVIKIIKIWTLSMILIIINVKMFIASIIIWRVIMEIMVNMMMVNIIINIVKMLVERI